MITALIRKFFTATTVATSERIRGNLSAGRKDTPGVWYKA